MVRTAPGGQPPKAKLVFIHTVLSLTVQRVALERFAVECAVPRMLRSDSDRVARIATMIDGVLTAPQPDALSMLRLDQHFHRFVYRSAGRPSLLRTIIHLRNRARAHMHLASTSVIDHMRDSQQVLELVLAARRDRDVATVAEVVTGHINHLLDVLRPTLGASLGEMTCS